MNYLDRFAIQFSGLKPGTYNFEFEVEEAFFEQYPESEIRQGLIKVIVDLERREHLLVLTFRIDGNVLLICDMCLDTFNYGINNTAKLIVKFGAEKNEDSDEIITIPESDHEINVAQYLYEFIHLSIPVKKVHPDDENGVSLCNKEVIMKLDEIKTKETDIDPRWEVLKKIKFN